MASTNPTRPKTSGTRNVKLLLTTLSLATTLSGWALLSLNGLEPVNLVEASAQEVANVEPALAPIQPAAPSNSLVHVPPLASLPVRGLREVSDPTIAMPSNDPDSPPRERQGGGGGGGGGGQAQAPAQAVAQAPQKKDPPAPKSKPKPVTKTKGSN